MRNNQDRARMSDANVQVESGRSPLLEGLQAGILLLQCRCLHRRQRLLCRLNRSHSQELALASGVRVTKQSLSAVIISDGDYQ
eukprot:4439314-Pyramimonas_sp.AAC.3